MSATIKSLPPAIALSQEPMLVTLATNNVTSARARLDITIVMSSTGPAINQVWTLGWAGKYLQFTFKGNPNYYGTQLPVCDPMTGVTKEYLHILAESLIAHEWISEQFEVIVNSVTDIITLQSRYDAPLSIVSISPVDNFTTTATNATSPYLQPNLTALLKVISRKGREIAKLSGSYAIVKGHLTPYEGRCTYDIGSLFDLAPHLPSLKSLDPMQVFTNAIAYRAYTQYFLRYADKYGTVPIAESLQRTAPQYAIFGGRSIVSQHAFVADTLGFYRCQSKLAIIVNTPEQPSYIYFFNTIRHNSAIVSIRLYLNNNTYIDVQSGLVHNIKANRLYYYRTGFNQLALNNVLTALGIGGSVISYDWNLVDSLSQEVKMTQRYYLEDSHYNSIYLAYSNGLGGIDTFHIKGGTIFKVEAERTIIRQGESLNQIGQIDRSIQAVWEMQTGVIPILVAEHLSQILVSDVWLIENKAFLPIIIDSKSLDTKTRGAGMVSMTFTFKAAWIDRNAV